jgi:phosphatidylglycerol:prolipoprotein diacylglycerol transferase
MFPVLHIGSLALRLPGLLLIIGIWLSTFLIDREAPRRGLPAGAVNSMVFYALLGGVIGARLGYALRFLDAYLSNPLALFSLTPGTLSPLDGFVAAGIIAVIYAQRRKLPSWPTLDALAPSFALVAVFVGAAHLSSGDAFGTVTDVPWAIELWGARRHPTQIYEIIGAAFIFLGTWRLRTRTAFSGFLFLIWLSMMAAGRLLLEGFRGDSVIILGSLRSVQLMSLAVLLTALALLHVLARRKPAEPAPSPAD